MKYKLFIVVAKNYNGRGNVKFCMRSTDARLNSEVFKGWYKVIDSVTKVHKTKFSGMGGNTAVILNCESGKNYERYNDWSVNATKQVA